MDLQSFVVSYLLALWISITTSILLIVLGWRRFANVLLGVMGLVIALWCYYAYEALHGMRMTTIEALFQTSGMALLYLPPMVYHFSCLATKRAWPNRFRIMLFYVINYSFFNAVEFNNFTIGTVDRFFVQYSIFTGPTLILYRIVFFATIGMTMLGLIDAYSKLDNYHRIRSNYVIISIPIFVYGFLTSPGFSRILADLHPRADAPLALGIFLLITGYAMTVTRMSEITRSLVRFGIFIGLVSVFVWSNNTLTIFLLAQIGITHYHYVHWIQTAVLTILTGTLLVTYHSIYQWYREKHGVQKSNESLLLRIATKILAGSNVEESIRLTLDSLTEQLGISESAILLKEPLQDRFQVKDVKGIEQSAFDHFNFGTSLTKWLSHQHQPFIVSEAEQSMSPSTFYQLTYALRELPIEVCLPLIVKKQMIGLLLLGRKKKNTLYTDRDLHFLNGVGTILATAIDSSKLSDEAVIDGLTHLYHQRYFKTRLEEELRVSNQVHSAMALIMFDIDHFKKLNDTQGHQAGDKIIESVASILRQCVRSNDVIARYGGEEFAVYLQEGIGPHDPAAAIAAQSHDLFQGVMSVAEKIRSKIEHHVVVFQDNIFQVTVSVGVGYKHASEVLSMHELIQRADQALYYAKEHGRNQAILLTRKGIQEIPRSSKPAKRIDHPEIDPRQGFPKF